MHFRYLLRIIVLPTFSYISIVVSACLGRFSQNGSICVKISMRLVCASLALLPDLFRTQSKTGEEEAKF